MFADPHYVQIISHEGQGSILKSTRQKKNQNLNFAKFFWHILYIINSQPGHTCQREHIIRIGISGVYTELKGSACVINSVSLSLREIQVPASLWSYFHQPPQYIIFFFYVFLLKDPYFILLTHWHSLMANSSVSHAGMKLSEDKQERRRPWVG